MSSKGGRCLDLSFHTALDSFLTHVEVFGRATESTIAHEVETLKGHAVLDYWAEVLTEMKQLRARMDEAA